MTDAWRRAGVPIVRGLKRLSALRQPLIEDLVDITTTSALSRLKIRVGNLSRGFSSANRGWRQNGSPEV